MIHGDTCAAFTFIAATIAALIAYALGRWDGRVSAVKEEK